MTDKQHVLDHLDEVAQEAALLPVDEQVVVLDLMVSRLQARQADAVRELETCGGLEGTGCKTVGSWARTYLRRDHSGFRLSRRARLLPSLPRFAAAFAAGAITEEHVDLLIRWIKPCGLAAVQANEDTLVTLARAASAKELKEALELLADLERPDRDEDRVTALSRRSFSCKQVGHLVQVDALVEPALGEALKTAVEAGAKLPAGIKPADDGRSLLQRRADAFGEIVLAGIATDSYAPDRRQTDADDDAAKGEGQRDGGGGRRRRTAGEGGRLRAQVALTVTLDQLAGIKGAPRALLAHFGVVPAPTVQRLVCDGDLARVVLDVATGMPLDVGRTSRLAVRRQRRALATIFRRCAFPGCSAPFRFCEIHHLDWWCHGGATDLQLLVPYCWTHHHFLHEFGFSVRRQPTDDGGAHLVHYRPDRQVIPDPDTALRLAADQLSLTHPNGADPPARTHPPPETRHPPRVA